MMGATDIFKTALGDFPEGDVRDNGLAARALIREGLAVLLIQPGGKKPLCTLTTRQATTADNAAQKAAREGGTVNWERVRHDCGVYHAMTDVKELNKPHIKAWLESGANLAVVPHMSSANVIVVDLDTREEWKGFLTDWAEADASFTPDPAPPMTVTSPGVLTAEVDGEPVWTHKDGGHFWFTLPTDCEPLPEHPGKLKGPTGWTVYYGSGYVLVPPSVRAEGPYRLTGACTEAPAWLLDRIRAGGTTGSAEELRERIRSGEGDEGIDSWSASTPWADLLGACGYSPTEQLDSCGCPTWTRPGQPAHTKSVTAHETGCPQYDTDTGHGPIHAWSDSVEWGGKKTVTKLTFWAWERFEGNMTAAMAFIGVSPNTGASSDDLDFSEGMDILEAGGSPKVDGVTALVEEVEEAEEPDTWRPKDLAKMLAGTIPVLTPTMLPRDDGRCLFYAAKVHSVHGESESGKSLVLMGEASRLMKAGQDVLWITFDSDEEEDVGRALRFGVTVDEVVAHLHYVRPEVSPASTPESRAAFIELTSRPYAMAVVDGVIDAMSLITAGAKGDPNEVYSQFFRILPKRLARKTGAAVILVDHVVKDAESRGRYAIGAQGKMATITGAAYTVEPDKDGAPVGGGVGAIMLRVGKDRPKEVRRYCGPRRARDRTQLAARVVFDDTGTHTVMTVEAPELDPFTSSDAVGGVAPSIDVPFDVMQLVSEFLEDRPDGMTKKEIETAITGRAERIRLAITELDRLDYVRIERVGTALVVVFLAPYLAENGDCSVAQMAELEAS